MPGRRELSFACLDEVMPDVERLLLGHATVGHWTLGQICNHLAKALHYTIDGFPARPPWLIRKVFGPVVRRQIFRTGRMREGIQLPEVYLPRPGLDARAEADALRGALARF